MIRLDETMFKPDMSLAKTGLVEPLSDAFSGGNAWRLEKRTRRGMRVFETPQRSNPF
jgi:hypothetical protein